MTHVTSRYCTHRGFTLVEILVVVGIIIILSAMLFPAVRSAVNGAKRAACMQNLQLIAQATMLAREEGDGYPPMPNFIGSASIPQGGITELPTSSRLLNAGDLWCVSDTSQEGLERFLLEKLSAAERSAYQGVDGKIDHTRFLRDNGLLKDTSSSSYAFWYNYYGYVATTHGLPFPITTPQAAIFFHADPNLLLNSDFASRYFSPQPNVTAGDFAQEWDLRLVKNYLPGAFGDDIVPHGMFPGLRNSWASTRTPITFCPHHLVDDSGPLPVVMLSGEATVVALPKLDAADKARYSGAYSRTAVNASIDWRVNKTPMKADAQNNNLLSDTPNSNAANAMPVVLANYRRFATRDLQGGDYWYNTGINIQPGTMVMVLAHARWAWADNTLTGPFASQAYADLADGAGYLWFSADGDPVEFSTRSGDNPALPLVNAPQSMLIGRIGNASSFPLGSRGSHYATVENGPLLLSINQPASSFTSNRGWCEVWIATCKP